MGFGLLLASLVATLYYKDWELYSFSYITTFCVGFGTLIFTCTCLYVQRLTKKNARKEGDKYVLNKRRCLLIVFIGIMLALWLSRQKLMFYESRFGGVDFSQMLFMIRISDREDEFLQLPTLLARLNTINQLLSVYVYLISSYAIIHKWGVLSYILGGIYFVLMVYNGMLTGAKGNMFMPFISLGIFLVYMAYLQRQTIKINFKKIALFTLLGFVFLGSLRTISGIIGREGQTEVSNSELVAEYIGAEIKNIDLEIQGKAKNVSSNNFLGYTLRGLYDDLNIKNNSSFNFLSVGNKTLGNVYTEFYPYYMDGGVLGCFILPFIAALICMLFYTQMSKSLEERKIMPISLMYYSSISYSIFMSFFDGYILNGIISIYFLKVWLIAFPISFFIIKSFILKKSLNGKN